jgi:uncharacterized membrane protein
MDERRGIRPVGVASAGHGAFALALIGLGIQALVTRDFAPTFGPVPEHAPAREALVSFCAAVSVAGGVALLVRPLSGWAARVLLAFSLLWFFAVRVPYFLFVSPGVDGWYSCCQTLVMTAAPWVLVVWFRTGPEERRFAFTGQAGLRVARALYGFALIPFGLAHFLYLEATAPLVPDWLPGHVAWAYLTGATFIAAGLAILAGVWARLAAALSVAQMALFALLVWVPRASAGTLSDFQKGEFVATLALAAAAWVVADSYRGVPWLAPRGRASGSPSAGANTYRG